MPATSYNKLNTDEQARFVNKLFLCIFGIPVFFIFLGLIITL